MKNTRYDNSSQFEKALYNDLVSALNVGVYRIKIYLGTGIDDEDWKQPEDTPFKFEFLNDRFSEILGIPKDQILNNPGVILNKIHPDFKEDFALKNAESNKNFSPFEWEGKIISKDDETWIKFESMPRMAEDSSLVWTGILTDITDRKHLESSQERLKKEAREEIELQSRQIELQKQYLEKKHIALREVMVMSHREKEKLGDQIMVNVEKLLMPQILALKNVLDERHQGLVEIIEHNLREITAPFAKKLTDRLLKLTPKEIEICNYIKAGKSSKEISLSLHITLGTVMLHRNNIRKKLNLDKTKINLATYLNNS